MPTKRRATKRTKTISGMDASILSFVARNGLPSREQRREIKKYLTAHIIKVAFTPNSQQGANKKGRPKKGQKTLSQLRRLAETNASERPISRGRTALPLTMTKSAGK